MNCFCSNTNNDDKPDHVKMSALSIPFNSEPCICLNCGRQGTTQNMELVASTNRRRENLIDDETAALEEEMQGLNLFERREADQTVLGNIAAGIRIDGYYSDVFDPTIQRNLFRELEETINRIESEIGNASNPQFEAYKLARDQNAAYVKHPAFTIGFLRAELYVVEKAAYRMFRYLKIKLDLFGEEKLTQDILIDDLGEDAKRYLERGGLQVLPKRDSSGRRVVFGTGLLNGSSDASAIDSAVGISWNVRVVFDVEWFLTLRLF